MKAKLGWAFGGLLVGIAAMAMIDYWRWNVASSCEALLHQNGIPNPFLLQGSDCAVINVGDRPEAFAPQSLIRWHGKLVKSLGRNESLVVVRECDDRSINEKRLHGAKPHGERCEYSYKPGERDLIPEEPPVIP